ncbi:unnamed protein product [Meloidogyne enterolobii]|uniref:Uncharacterized protein n=1 Tax=Meloidogyne enterolobii TaxID=390850 RepID=A0ACB0ZVX3_MELEN
MAHCPKPASGFIFRFGIPPDPDRDPDLGQLINILYKNYFSKYYVHNGYPLNPVARTGFKGRGSNNQWGPTIGFGAILYVTDKEDSNKFEFIGVENGKYEKRSFIVTPGGFIDTGEKFEYGARRRLIEEAFGPNKQRNKEEFEKIEKIIGKGELVKFGINDLNQLDTDNAWTESITFAFGIDSTIKKELKLKKGSEAKQVMWIQIEPVDKGINVKAELEKLFSLEERIDYILENFEACLTSPKEEKTPLKETPQEEKAHHKEEKTPHEEKMHHKEEKTPHKEENKTETDSKDNTKNLNEQESKICYKFNSDKMLYMQDVAYLYLIKKYNEKTFLEILANKKVKKDEHELIFKEKDEGLNENEENLKKGESLEEEEESLNEENVGENVGEDAANKYNSI